MIWTLLLFGGLLIALFLVGVPVAFSILAASLVLFYLLTGGTVDPAIILQTVFSGLDSFPLLAIPLFVLAGNLMNTGGITTRLFRFASSIVGQMRFGLAQVSIVVGMIFSGMSGAATVDAAAVGKIEMKAMLDAKYDRDYSAAVVAASSTVGPVIPPSVPLVVVGIVSGTSIGKLLFGGIVPGILIGLSLMLLVAFHGKRAGQKRGKFGGWPTVWKTAKGAFLPILTPLILLGGIMSGVFTATESAAVATFYAAFLGIVVYREIDAKAFFALCKDTLMWTAQIMIIIGSASAFAYMVVLYQIPQHLVQFVVSSHVATWSLLLLINITLLIVGCFMETVAAITIMVPVLMPLVLQFGIDPVQFGLMVTLNLVLGLLTPPVGLVLFVTSKIAEISSGRMFKAVTRFYLPLVVVLLLVTYVPKLVTFLPDLLIGK